MANTSDSLIQNLITQKESISKRPVVDILQDSLGYIWYASSLDLTRYDGVSFQKYNNQQGSTHRINSVGVHSIHLRNNEDILIFYEGNEEYVDFIQRGASTARKIDLGNEGAIKHPILTKFVDKKGDLYSLTKESTSFQIYKLQNDFKFKTFLELELNIEGADVDQLISTKDGSFWMSSKSGQLFHFSKEGKLLEQFRISKDQSGSAPRLGSVHKSILYEDSRGHIWYAPYEQSGMFRYLPERQSFALFSDLPAELPYYQIWEDFIGNLIVGVSGRIWKMDALYHIDEYDKVTDYSSLLKEYDKINQIYARDFSRLIFVGSFIGLKKLGFRNAGIKNYLNQELEEGEWGWSIRGIAEAKSGNIYIAREQDEWYCLNPETGALEIIPFVINGKKEFIRNSFSLLYDAEENCLWGSRRDEGENYFLVRYDLQSKTFSQVSSPNFIQSLGLASDGTIWLGCGKSTAPGEVYTYDKKNKTFSLFLDKGKANPFRNTEARYIFESKDKAIWIGTKHGLYKISADRKNYRFYDSRSVPFSNNNIICIVENVDGTLMLGTEGGGLNVFNPVTEAVKVIGTKDGLSNDYLSGIVPDGKGAYWISTYDGISYYDYSDGSFRNFYVDDGLTFNEFNRFSFLKGQDGQLYFGGMNGVNLINPDQLLNSQSAPKLNLCLAKLTRFNASEEILIIDVEQLHNEEKIIISPHDSYFQIDFFLPDYRHPEKIQYRYQPIGNEGNWIDLGNVNNIRYHDLPAGKYALTIEAKTPGGQWGTNVQQLNIRVEEYFYKTKAAFFFYALGLSLLIAAIYRMYLHRKMEMKEAQRLKELDEFKSRFYANISHEFRTPLTLISGPLNRAIDQLPSDSRSAILEDLKIAENNSQRLLYLINRILDLSKLEAGKLDTNFIFGNIQTHVQSLLHSFRPLLESKQLSLDFQSDFNDPYIDLERQLVTHVLTNLLSNAIKFTPENGKISVSLIEEESSWILQVSDSGKGIQEDKLEAIFERFHTSKADNAMGVGIGLAFTKEIMELLNGKIDVANQKEGGAIFKISFPLTRELKKADLNMLKEEQLAGQDTVLAGVEQELSKAKVHSDSTPGILNESDDDRPLVLIVEDHFDVARFISKCLEKDFQTIVAEDGEIGLTKALDTIPDLVISDVMMPHKDGFELCIDLKNDERTSHIPVVLLTAKSELEARLQGLEHGADDYLAKPFHEKELIIRVNNLLRSRKILQAYYGGRVADNPPEEIILDPVIQTEQRFIAKAKSTVEEYLLDPGFDIPTFCKAMGMSRTQLHRKLTAITGHSASNFINSIRLDKAQELLLSSDQSISEVAYATGFNDPSYFTRIFSKFYDCSPSEYRMKHMS